MKLFLILGTLLCTPWRHLVVGADDVVSPPPVNAVLVDDEGDEDRRGRPVVDLPPPPGGEDDAPRHHHHRLPRHHRSTPALHESAGAEQHQERDTVPESEDSPAGVPEAERSASRHETQRDSSPEGGARAAFTTTIGSPTKATHALATAGEENAIGGEGPPDGGLETPSASSGSPGGSDGAKRLWGAAAASTGAAAVDTAGTAAALNPPTPTESAASLADASGEKEASAPNKTRAFVVPKQPPHGAAKHTAARAPPDGFALSARVYIDPLDKLAHFDTSVPHIPYWDCGHAGSTTSPLPLKSAYFRHALTGATSWSGTDGKHAVLVVPLSDIVMDLNSGASRDFPAGSVILLEDVLLAGHKMRPLHNNGVGGVSVLFLTLPQPFVHTGREHISLPASFLKPAVRDDPCPNKHPEGSETAGAGTNANASADDNIIAGTEVFVAAPLGEAEPTPEDRAIPWTGRHVRRTIFALVGVSLSTLAADFLGKTAPLWLAVGVGGTCFVAAGTWAIASGSDALWMAVQWHLERRKLGASGTAEMDEEAEAIEPAPML